MSKIRMWYNIAHLFLGVVWREDAAGNRVSISHAWEITMAFYGDSNEMEVLKDE